jgi:hypothetical protein
MEADGGGPVISWSRVAATPDSRRACGHARCGRLTRAGMALIGAGVLVITVTAIIQPAATGLPVAAALALGAAGAVLLFWPHPRDDVMALADALQAIPDYVPDWMTREQEQP